jgi:hypothetical protein
MPAWNRVVACPEGSPVDARTHRSPRAVQPNACRRPDGVALIQVSRRARSHGRPAPARMARALSPRYDDSKSDSSDSASKSRIVSRLPTMSIK